MGRKKKSVADFSFDALVFFFSFFLDTHEEIHGGMEKWKMRGT